MASAATTTRTARAGTREPLALATGVALVVSGVLPGFLTASLAPRIRTDFAFGASSVGLAVAVFYVVCTATSTPCGRLVERIGARRGMRLGAVATAVGCVAIAATAGSAVALIAMLAVAGLGNAAGVGFVSFVVLYAVHRGIDEGAAGVLLGGVSLATTLSRVGLGIAADRADADPLRPLAAMLVASLLGYALLIAGTPAL